MKKKKMRLLLLLLLQVVIVLALPESAFSDQFISDGVFQQRGSTGRSLLQAKKECPINFEKANYTIITSQCKGPTYPPDLCCPAFVKFACPYASSLNDATNDCVERMFSYLTPTGNFPVGLFASECVGDKKGLPCPQDSSSASNATSASTRRNSHTLADSVVAAAAVSLVVGYLRF